MHEGAVVSANQVSRQSLEAIILIGAQACGKSTFFARSFADTHVRINLDMLKTRHRERLLVDACIAMKQPFVVDNTNPTVADRARYLGPARAAGFVTKGFYLESKLADLVLRNSRRPKQQQVPERGVRGTHARLQLPSRSEGFDELYYVRIETDGGFAVEEWSDEV